MSGADQHHAELEARELRDVLRRLDDTEVHFAPPGAAHDAEGSKGSALLAPEAVLVLTGRSFTLAGTAIKAWVVVRRSRKARVLHPDGTATEFQGGVSGCEIRKLRDDGSKGSSGVDPHELVHGKRCDVEGGGGAHLCR
ncbi:effector-associated constant component EACC1 [Streptomyces nitrosporeus]|uniref:effector-associated constant component EACC1 n=1 Tax=Streptomyces nitrosporeus TaxID=28894 RepID=UPI0039A3666B